MNLTKEQRGAILAIVENALLDAADPPTSQRCFVRLRKQGFIDRIFLIDVPDSFKGEIAEYAYAMKLEPFTEMIRSGWMESCSGIIRAGACVEVG